MANGFPKRIKPSTHTRAKMDDPFSVAEGGSVADDESTSDRNGGGMTDGLAEHLAQLDATSTWRGGSI